MSHNATRPIALRRRSSGPRRLRLTAGAVLALVAGSSAALAQTTWTTGSTVTLNSTFTVTDTLTIEPGVTVRALSDVWLVVGPTGTLIVEGTDESPVLFTAQATWWRGIRFDPGSQGEITGAVIEKCLQNGVEIVDASPVIRKSTIRTIGVPTVVSSMEVAAVRIRNPLAHPIMLECVIENVAGFQGDTGVSGASGQFGADGAHGGLIFQDGEEGQPGTSGGFGSTGGTGRSAYGVYASHGATATLGYNTIRAVRGGKGGTGGQGGPGGWGGRGGNGFSGLANGGNGGRGGLGGDGGSAGGGGPGGFAEAIRVDSANEATFVFQNLIYSIEAGPGGDGGRRGNGGRGGDGGNGGDCSAPFCTAGNGGNGRAGGNASAFGGAGEGAGASAIADIAGDALFINNTIADIRRGVGGNPGPGGAGGSGGLRGLGGTASASGTNGLHGFNGGAGLNSAAGSGAGGVGFTRGLTASGGAEVQLYNNAMALPNNGTMLTTGPSSLITADYNVFAGYTTFSSGSLATGPNNIQADPVFIDPNGGDFRLSLLTSPAIDAGNNLALPPDIFDMDNDGDVMEPIPLDHAGNPRVTDDDLDGDARVNIGALEGGVAALAYQRNADSWLAATSSVGYAFDEFFPGILNGTGCLSGQPSAPAALSLDGGAMFVSSHQGGAPVCAVTDASTPLMVSDATLNNGAGDGMVVLEFDPPVTAFYTYFGSLAVGHTATMRLFTAERGAIEVLDTITSEPSAASAAATGLGFRSLAPVNRVEITTSEPGSVLVGAFAGLVEGEPSLGTVELPGYLGPNGQTVELDFACEFAAVEIPCDPDVNGDGVVNFADLNAVLGAFGQTGDLPADTNGDGTVNFADLNAVLATFGSDCP